MTYRNNTLRFSLLALLLALALIGNFSFTNVGASRPPAIAAASGASLSLADKETDARITEGFGKLPLYFVENSGQLDKRVAYYVQGADKTIYFTNQGLTFALNKPNGTKADAPQSLNPQSERWALKLDFVGARSGVRPVGQEQTGATFSYFKGSRSQWKAGLKSYSQLVYHDLWPGIDLVYAGTVNRMKYTFVVKPGADPKQIKLAWRGASGVKLNDKGELEVKTPLSGFTDERPISWQEVDGQRVDVASRYQLEATSKRRKDQAAIGYGFAVGDYDRSRELVIDPAVLVYCGYIGGNGSDSTGRSIAVDSAGNAYVTGTTSSTEASFPVTVGPDLTHGGTNDAFVAKINASGTALDYCGYIGGSGNDIGNGIAVDSAGNAYITGITGSTEASFPVTVGPDLTYNGSIFDVFVAKVNPSGTALDYCGYIGGSNLDQGNDIAVDSAGNAYVTGTTASTEANFPVTVGPDLTHNGGTNDAFVAKVNASGTALDYCGYIGGSGADLSNGIAVDSAGDAYVTGVTTSTASSFPVTVGPDLTFNGGSSDAYVAKVNAGGTALDYCGYIGGSGGEQNPKIAVDSAGNAYVTGATSSTEATFPVTVGPDLTFGGLNDAFVAKVNASGSALDYCGYIGGSGNDFGNDIAVDSAGNAYIIGDAQSTETTFPVTVGPDLTHNGGTNPSVTDAFVAKVNASGTALDYCGYIGGSANENGGGIAVDSAGNAYVSGTTSSTETTFPVTVGPDLTYNSGSSDAFVAKITDQVNQAPVAMCQDVTVVAAASCTADASIDNGSFDPDSGDTITLTQSPAGPYSVGTTSVTLTVTDDHGASSSCSSTVTVLPNPSPVASITGPASGSIYAVGTPVNFTGIFTDNAGDTHTATWMFDTINQPGTVNETTGEVTASYTFTAAGVYLVSLTVSDNCGGSSTADTVDGLTAMVVVYDPSAGWVTGGGWINSPLGAYAPNPMLTGKANFGFVSKYQNGASVPTGNTEFHFKAGDLKFKSTSYEWMVVSGGKKAQFKGFGTINGAGNYRFMLTTIDGDQPSGDGADKFRIRIWSDGGGLVYDNQLSAPDSDDPTTVLGGGSIVIHH